VVPITLLAKFTPQKNNKPENSPETKPTALKYQHSGNQRGRAQAWTILPNNHSDARLQSRLSPNF